LIKIKSEKNRGLVMTTWLLEDSQELGRRRCTTTCLLGHGCGGGGGGGGDGVAAHTVLSLQYTPHV